MLTTTTPVASAVGRDLVGGHRALEFVNTLHWRLRDEPQEALSFYADLLEWARRVDLLEEAEARSLTVKAQHDPVGAEGALADALELREVLYRVFVAVARNESPDVAALEHLKAQYAEAIGSASLDHSTRVLSWDESGVDPWHRVTAQLAAAGMELFLSEEANRVKQCADQGCGWLFLDTSKNHSRRWCSMDICGSRAKMRRHYRRKKATLGT